LSIIIGFDGSSGGGKTTLINELTKILEKEGYDVGVVQEVGREVFKEFKKKGFTSLTELRESSKLIEFQRKCLIEHYLKEDIMLSNHEIVLSDRTLFGNEFFTLFYCNKDFKTLNEYFNKLEEYIRVRKLTHGKIYDAIVITPPLPNNIDVDDGFRTPDLPYREIQAFVIKQLAEAYVDPIIELKTHDLDERINLVKPLIDYLVVRELIC
jgi:nicotinamide riboside kinase